MNKNFLLTNTIVISQDLFIEDGEILIRNGKIVSVGKKGESKKSKDIIEYDLGGRISMPGFVNPHTHLYSELATALSPKVPTPDFTSILEQFWWPLDSVHNEESIYYSALSGIN